MGAPSGIVAFLFTDVVGSTALWERDRRAMSESLRVHDEVLRGEIDAQGGYTFTTAGDSFCAAFKSARAAVGCALAIQRQLKVVDWPGPQLQLRTALHVGEAEERDGDYFGPVVNTAARVMTLAAPGQILATDAMCGAAEVEEPRQLGHFQLEGIDRQVALSQIGPGDFAPPSPSPAGDGDPAPTERFADFEIDIAARELRTHEGRVHVEPQVFDVLAYLIAHRDRLVSREELLDQVWGDQFVSLSALTSRIKAARRAIGDDGRTQRYIRNERGRGYQFVGEPHPVSEHPTAEQQAPHAPSRVSRPLPATPHQILGRDSEVDDISELLDNASLVTLVGPGGIGKTRCAIEVGSRWINAQRRPAEFVALDTVRAAEEVPASLATSLALDAPPHADLVEACADALAAPGQLLIVDNCEHVLDTIRSVVQELGERSPNLAILATSREPLHLQGEHVYRLPTLAVPDPGAEYDLAAPAAGLELFVAAAKRSDWSFELSSDNADVVAELCRRLDGLPLAMELAASRLGSFDLATLVSGLGDEVPLAGLRSTTTPRHHSLRATVEWSMGLLDEPATSLFALLSSFPAGLNLPDIQRLFAPHFEDRAITELVAQLVDASMLVRETAAGETIYRMLETLREAGNEQLDSLAMRGVAEAALSTHALQLAAAERAAWLAWQAPPRTPLQVCREIPNLRAARELWLSQGNLDAVTQLSVGLLPVTEESCLAELWSWHEDSDPSSDEGALLHTVSDRNRGENEATRARAAQLLARSSDPWITGRAQLAYGMSSLFMGDMDAAAAAWLAMDDALGGCRGRALGAMLAAYRGDIEAADEALAASREAFATDAIPVVRSSAFYAAGEVAMVSGRSDARALHETAVDIARDSGCWFVLGVSQVSLARLQATAGDRSAAATTYAELVDRWLRSSTWPQLWITLRQAAEFLVPNDDETSLLIWLGADGDEYATAMDDDAERHEQQLRAEVAARLGPTSAAEVSSRAARSSRVEIAAAAAQALGALSEG